MFIRFACFATYLYTSRDISVPCVVPVKNDGVNIGYRSLKEGVINFINEKNSEVVGIKTGNRWF